MRSFSQTPSPTSASSRGLAMRIDRMKVVLAFVGSANPTKLPGRSSFSASASASFVTGQIVTIDGGKTAG